MTRFAPATLAALLATALLAAACGETRESADVVDTPAVDAEAETSDGSTDDADASADETAADSDLPATTPPTTGAAGEAAMTVNFDGGDSVAITHGDLAEVAYASRQNTEFVDALYQGSMPPGFDQAVLTGLAINEALDRALDDAGVAVADDDRKMASDGLKTEIAGFIGEGGEQTASSLLDSTPYLQLLADVQAKQVVLGTALGADAEGVRCARHILVESEEDAIEVAGLLDAGGDFAELAAEWSTGPTSVSGGDLGCGDSSQYVPEFATAMDGLEIDEVSGPVQTEFGWHLITIYEAPPDPSQLAGDTWSSMLSQAAIEVDPALGSWDPEGLAVRGTATG